MNSQIQQKREIARILERTLVFSLLLIIGSVLGPIAYKYYTHTPLEIVEIVKVDQDWTITLTSPNADEYETWYYHGPKPEHYYNQNCSYLDDPKTFRLEPIKIEDEEIKAPVGWYLDIKKQTNNANHATRLLLLRRPTTTITHKT